MSYEAFYNEVSAIVKENYSKVNIANKVIATLEQFRLDQEAAQQSVEPTRSSGEAIPGVCDEKETMKDIETKYWKWSLWYSGNKSQFSTMDDMLKDAFSAGYEAAIFALICLVVIRW